MASSMQALKEALKAVLPSIEFEDDELDYFLTSLEEGGSDAAVIESWNPVLISRSAASDDTSAGELCTAILRQLRAAASTSEIAGNSTECIAESQESAVGEVVVGLGDWLKELRLDAYTEKVEKWCSTHGINDVVLLRQKLDALLENVEFKRCEITRLKRDVAANANAATTVGDRLREAKAQAILSDCQTFGTPPYAIKDFLGKGASAVVHRCHRFEDCIGDVKEYAVKIISLRPMRMHPNCKQQTQRIMSEISILLSLQHRNIVTLYDVVHDNNQEKLYLVMELVAGGDLFEYIRNNKCLTEEKACDIFLQLADALRYIHEKKIVHRDLKPENILVDKSSPSHPQVKITDFGASKFSDDGYEFAQTKVGTEQYWAPEVQDAKGRKKGYDEKVDLWSLGCVLYVMLTGSYPFYDEDGGDSMAEKIQQGKFKFDRNRPISTEARDLIKKLIKPNPNDRLSLEGCLNHAWTKKFPNKTTSREDDTEDCEESISLPADVRAVDKFKADLSNFSINFKCGCTVRGKREVVVVWKRAGHAQSDEALEKARLELQKVFRNHFEGFSLPPRIPSRQSNGLRGSGYQRGKPLAPVLEEK